MYIYCLTVHILFCCFHTQSITWFAIVWLTILAKTRKPPISLFWLELDRCHLILISDFRLSKSIEHLSKNQGLFVKVLCEKIVRLAELDAALLHDFSKSPESPPWTRFRTNAKCVVPQPDWALPGLKYYKVVKFAVMSALSHVLK